MEQLLDLEQKIDTIKDQKIEAFDKLAKNEELVQSEIDVLVDETLFHHSPQVDNEIK